MGPISRCDLRSRKQAPRVSERTENYGEIVDARIIYGSAREEQMWFEIGERVLMKKHLEYLLEKKQIEISDGRYVRR